MSKKGFWLNDVMFMFLLFRNIYSKGVKGEMQVSDGYIVFLRLVYQVRNFFCFCTKKVQYL